jgi:hypothetical protein
MAKKVPVGIWNFKEIIENGYYYVDKSLLIQDIDESGEVVLDGGSTDETLDIIRHYEDRLAWWVSEPDGGQSEAINKGIALGYTNRRMLPAPVPRKSPWQSRTSLALTGQSCSRALPTRIFRAPALTTIKTISTSRLTPRWGWNRVSRPDWA